MRDRGGGVVHAHARDPRGVRPGEQHRLLRGAPPGTDVVGDHRGRDRTRRIRQGAGEGETVLGRPLPKPGPPGHLAEGGRRADEQHPSRRPTSSADGHRCAAAPVTGRAGDRPGPGSSPARWSANIASTRRLISAVLIDRAAARRAGAKAEAVANWASFHRRAGGNGRERRCAREDSAGVGSSPRPRGRPRLGLVMN